MIPRRRDGLAVVAILIAGAIQHGISNQTVVCQNLGFDFVGNVFVFFFASEVGAFC